MPPVNLSRRKFLKLAGLGFTGGVLAACNPTHVDLSLDPPTQPASFAATPTPSFTLPPEMPTMTPARASPTVKPSATQTFAPSVTPTPVPPTPSPDVLTELQKDRLAKVALEFQAYSEGEAIEIARSLGYLVNDGHPASVCGPLSLAILRDAGLVSPYVDLHEFWLLNPREGSSVLERAFPKEDFTWFRTEESIATFDFSTFPLEAGDFIYLYAGDPGSFEHMLTVSRVDSAGRAYAVTNFDTPEGFRIQEVMLYDPLQPGVGKFFDWTNRKFARIGMTGFGGFLLFRFLTPVRDKSTLELEFSRDLDRAIEEAGGTWRIYIKEIAGSVLYARDERRTMHPASIIKVPVAMLFFKSLEMNGIVDFPDYLKKGIDGRSYNQLLRSMLVNSEEAATDSLEKAILENHVNEREILDTWGAPRTYLGVRQSTALDMATLFEGLYAGRCVGEKPREIILGHLQAYTPGDDLRLGEIRRFLPPGYAFYNKRGTITDGFLVVADTAIIQVPTSAGVKEYITAVYAYQGENTTTYSRLEYALGQLAVLLWKYSQTL